MIITTVDKSDFRAAFHAYGRADQFSYAALGVLYEYYDELSNDLGEPIELDVVAICSEWSEYDSAVEALNDIEAPEYAADNDEEDDARAYLEDKTTVLDVRGGGVLVMNY